MIRRLSLAALAALVALAVAPVGAAQPTPLFPGATYDRDIQFTAHGPVALHVVRGPRPVGLYRLRPVLSNETIVGRETLSAMQTRLSSQATSVGVNGDYFSFEEGRPSGIFLRDGVLGAAPNDSRSSAGFTLDGLLDVQKVKLHGTWRGTGLRRVVHRLNRAPAANGVALFTSDWGMTTPQIPGSFAVILAPFPAAAPNADLVAPVASISQDASVAIQPGTAVLVARGTSAALLQAEAPVGGNVTVRLILQPNWSTVSDAIGGGPVLVRDGAPVYRSNEGFTTSQLVPRAPRTAVGQRSDGSILLVAVDGRQPGYSVGLSNFELALTMVRLGAVRAMAFDGGGSSTIAFEGSVLNSPSDGKERPVSTALFLQYSGVYAPPPLESVVSPNGDGVAEAQKLSFKVVRPSTVTITLTAPDGTIAAQETSTREPGVHEVPFPPLPLPEPPPPEGQPSPAPTEPLPPAEGRWALSLSATDDQGLVSSTIRRFAVNSTLGFMRVAPTRVVVRKSGGKASIRWTQARAARVKVTVETSGGVVLRTVLSQVLQPGEQATTWNGRTSGGKIVDAGAYVVRVAAANELGSVSLRQPVAVRRTPSSKR